jgi:hypothetical protein
LTSEQTGINTNGIDIKSFGPDGGERIDRRRTTLASITPADDPASPTFAARASTRIDSSVASFPRH